MRRRKCRCCKDLFAPDYRNKHHQEFCGKPDCRHVSKKASQDRWLRKSGQGYFRGQENSARVKEWRKKHAGYWRKSKRAASSDPEAPIAQDFNLEQKSCNAPPQKSRTLQDFCIPQDPVVLGLISMVTGSTLQEDIASTARKLHARGQDILGLGSAGRSATQSDHDYQTRPSG